ncbi:hypothetical protein NIES3974_37930 [Calothrix sp. NIES-3974]|nr:hypothetical protein NIES3974_37930 [Calothrix sp. NIES-3974]
MAAYFQGRENTNSTSEDAFQVLINTLLTTS